MTTSLLQREIELRNRWGLYVAAHA